MATATAYYTTPPLRKVFSVSVATAGTGGGDSNTIVLAHGIDFTDNTALPPTQTEVFVQGNNVNGSVSGAPEPYYVIDATNITLGFGGTHPANASLLLTVERVHSYQG